MQSIPAVESQRIDDISNNVTRAKAALEACVRRLEPKRIAHIDRTSSSALLEAQATRQIVSRNHNIMMHAMAEISALHNELRLPDERTIKDIFKECFKEALASEMQTGLYRLVEETEYRKSEPLHLFLIHMCSY